MQQPPHSRNTAANPATSVISVGVVLAVLGATMVISLHSPLKDDIAWLLYVARQWMGGRELYVDLVEVNPPLIIWISALPVALADWLHVDAQFVAMPFFIAGVLGCAWWTACLLRKNGGLFANRWPVFAVIGCVVLIVPGSELGQREHLLIAATLPYLVLFAQRLDGRRSSIATALAAGILAGLGCALKPPYAAIFVALEGVALANGLRPWRVMPIAAAATMIVYAGLIVVFCPAYVWHIVPLALALYGVSDVPFVTLLRVSAVLLAKEAVAIVLLWLRRRDMPEYKLMLTLLVFAVTSTILCFAAGKDWYYHRLPATIATVLALLLWVTSEMARQRLSVRWPIVVAAIAVAVFCVSTVRRMEPVVALAMAPRDNAPGRLEHLIRKEHAHSYLAFSDWLALGFPVVDRTDVIWTSRFVSMWALNGQAWRARFDPATAREWPIAQWVAADFITGCPDLVAIDMRDKMNYIKVLTAANPAFGRVWAAYRPIAAFDSLIVYKRGGAECRDALAAIAESRR